MGVNLDKMKKNRERHEGGFIWTPQEGDTLFYLCSEDGKEDGYPYVETGVHWSVGASKTMVACLDPRRNPALKDENVLRILDEMKIDWQGGCPVCEKITSENLWDTNRDEASSLNFNSRFYWLVVPMFYRKSAGEEYGKAGRQMVKPWCCGKTVWTDIDDIFSDEGDITSRKEAILVKLSRSGKGRNTNYKASVDSISMKEPIDLPEFITSDIDKAYESKEYNLFRLVAQDFRSRSEIQAMLQGIKVEVEQVEEEEMRRCFGSKKAYNKNDPDCQNCGSFEECGEIVASKTTKPVKENKVPVKNLDKEDIEDIPYVPETEQGNKSMNKLTELLKRG